MRLAKWFYRGGRPNQVARMVNRCWAAVHALGVAPNYLVTLEVPGRRSGRIIRLPLVMVVVAGERYLVSMLGAEVDWVRNVRAARGNVTLRHGRRCERGGSAAKLSATDIVRSVSQPAAVCLTER